MKNGTHAQAHAHARDACAHGQHLARAAGQRHVVRQFGHARQQSLDEQQIAEIQRRGLESHQRLARTGSTHVDIAQFQRVDTLAANGICSPALHDAPPAFGSMQQD